jgi:hypothetical protein
VIVVYTVLRSNHDTISFLETEEYFMLKIDHSASKKLAVLKNRLANHEVWYGHPDFTPVCTLGLVVLHGVSYCAVAYEQINTRCMATMDEWRTFLASTVGSAFLGTVGAEALFEQAPSLLEQGYGYVTPCDVPSTDERGRMVTSALTYDRHTGILRVGHDMTYSADSGWKHNMRFVAFVPEERVHH